MGFLGALATVLWLLTPEALAFMPLFYVPE